jgi:hypothetical protein
MNFCVLILSSKHQSYDGFKEVIRKTWALDLKKNNIDCFFYEGDWGTNTLDGDLIKLDVKSEDEYSFKKFIQACTFLRNQNLNYDFIYRTNLSTYIDVSNFIKYIKIKEINQFSYCGLTSKAYLLPELTLKFKLLRKFAPKLRFGKRIAYKNGAGFFIGSLLINELINTYKPIENCYLEDDVFIGLLLEHKKIREANTLIRTIFADGSHKVLKKQYQNEIDKNLLFHYRFKIENIESTIKMLESFHDSNTRLDVCTFKYN